MNFEHGGNILEISKSLSINDNELFDFSVNINPLGIPDIVKDTIIKNIDKIKYYPEIKSFSLKNKIASYIGYSYENIVIGNGSSQIIYSLVPAISLKKAVIIEPTFSEYRNALDKYSCKIYSYFLKEEENFTLNINNLIKYLKKQSFDAVFLCNPNNPNGSTVDINEVEEVANFLEKEEKFFIIDEAFIDFTSNISASKLNLKYTIILKSLTKIFAIPGLRLGYLKASKKIVNKVEKYIEPWSINIFSQIIGEKLCEIDNYIKNTKKFLEKERSFIVKELSKIKNIKLFPSCTNYLLIKILNSVDVNQLEDYLIKKNILIRNCSNYVGLNNKFFRISINNRRENELLINYLKEFFKY